MAINKNFLKANYKIVASLAGAALLVALVVVLSFWAFRQIETSTAARKHTYTLISRANALLSEMKDAETGQRGYSLTGDEAFLEPYLAVRNNLNGDLQELRRLTYDQRCAEAPGCTGSIGGCQIGGNVACHRVAPQPSDDRRTGGGWRQQSGQAVDGFDSCRDERLHPDRGRRAGAVRRRAPIEHAPSVCPHRYRQPVSRSCSHFRSPTWSTGKHSIGSRI